MSLSRGGIKNFKDVFVKAKIADSFFEIELLVKEGDGLKILASQKANFSMPQGEVLGESNIKKVETVINKIFDSLAIELEQFFKSKNFTSFLDIKRVETFVFPPWFRVESVEKQLAEAKEIKISESEIGKALDSLNSENINKENFSEKSIDSILLNGYKVMSLANRESKRVSVRGSLYIFSYGLINLIKKELSFHTSKKEVVVTSFPRVCALSSKVRTLYIRVGEAETLVTAIHPGGNFLSYPTRIFNIGINKIIESISLKSKTTKAQAESYFSMHKEKMLTPDFSSLVEESLNLPLLEWSSQISKELSAISEGGSFEETFLVCHNNSRAFFKEALEKNTSIRLAADIDEDHIINKYLLDS